MENAEGTRSGLTATAQEKGVQPIQQTNISPRGSKRSPLYRLKQWAWRTTAVLLWLRFLGALLGINAVLEDSEGWFFRSVTDAMASIGFAPVDATYLPTILKVGWLLLITAFSPSQFAGFLVYVFFFPISMSFLLLFRDVIAEHLNTAPDELRPGLRPKASNWPLVPVTVLGLLSWFLLYGDASSARHIFPGVMLSGMLFLFLLYRSFQRTKLFDKQERFGIESIGMFGLKLFLAGSNKKYEKKVELAFDKKLYQLMRFVYLRLALAARGRRGRERVALYVLMEYVLSLLWLGASAVLFWGLAAKLAASPAHLPFHTSLLLSASYFLPGLPAWESGALLPLWTRMGPAITAWVLFVLYVGAAASLLPGRHDAYINRLGKGYKSLRLTAVLSARTLRKLKDAIP